MEKPLFKVNDRTCEHRKRGYELLPAAGAWADPYNDPPRRVEVNKCALTDTECISDYKFDCPRYATALALSKTTQQDKGA